MLILGLKPYHIGHSNIGIQLNKNHISLPYLQMIFHLVEGNSSTWPNAPPAPKYVDHIPNSQTPIFMNSWYTRRDDSDVANNLKYGVASSSTL